MLNNGANFVWDISSVWKYRGTWKVNNNCVDILSSSHARKFYYAFVTIHGPPSPSWEYKYNHFMLRKHDSPLQKNGQETRFPPTEWLYSILVWIQSCESVTWYYCKVVIFIIIKFTLDTEYCLMRDEIISCETASQLPLKHDFPFMNSLVHVTHNEMYVLLVLCRFIYIISEVW